ncbi:MAG: DUF4350 domain-containing protein [Myxococcota bacterium]
MIAFVRAATALLSWVLLLPTWAHAQPDYLRTDSWNGLNALEAVLGEEASESQVVAADEVDLSNLTPDDSLFIIYPNDELPVRSLAAFLRAGGRIVLADDFGYGDQLLRVYSIHRRAPPSGVPSLLRGNHNLPLAQPTSTHLLTQGVNAVVTNHPTALEHRELDPILGFDRSGSALCLAGAVDQGRLVAISDPSIFINNMLEFRGNERFVRNIVHYLTEGRSGTIYLVAPPTSFTGRYGEPGSDTPFYDLQQWLSDLAALDMPPLAITFMSIVCLAIFVVVSVTSIPRKSPYEGAAMFAPRPASGGFVGRVQYFEQRNQNLLQPALVYKYELEAELVRRLGLDQRTLLKDVISALKARGFSDVDVTEVRNLLLSLDDLRERQDHPRGPPGVFASRFQELVARGERILERVGSNP